VTAIPGVEIENPPSMLQVVELVCAVGDAEHNFESNTLMTDAPLEQANCIPMAEVMRMLGFAALSAEVSHPDGDDLETMRRRVVLPEKLSKDLSDRVQALGARNEIGRTESPLWITGEKPSPAGDDDSPHITASGCLEDVVRPDDVVLKHVFPGCRGSWIAREVNNHIHSFCSLQKII